jgi:TRAP-type uncharacterized transport system substrate-binding protein
MRFGTVGVGTYGYKISAMLMSVLDEEFPAHYEFIAFPFATTAAAMKATMHGGGEGAYGADVSMTELYARTGPFTGFTPRRGELVHTFYFVPAESMLAVRARDAHLFRSWADFSGVRGFYHLTGAAHHLEMKRAFRILGYEFKHVEMGLAAAADALERGTVDVVTLVSVARSILSPWVVELDLRTDITIINPTPAERAKMTAAGMLMARVGPEVFTQDVGVPEIWGVSNVFGFQMRADAYPEFVYNMLTAFYRRRADLYKFDRGFGPLNEDFVGLQVAGISANPHVPVHPGLHRFLVEKGAWNPAWTVAS